MSAPAVRLDAAAEPERSITATSTGTSQGEKKRSSFIVLFRMTALLKYVVF
jgi:hypothetical protein